MNRDTRRLRLLLILLVLTSFTLITLDYRSGRTGPLAGLRSGVSGAVGAVEDAVASAVRPVGRALSSVAHLGSYRSENDKLSSENAQLRSQLRAAGDLRAQAAELDRMLRLAGTGTYRVVPARVVGIGDALGFEWTATIDAGSRDGLRPDMTVLSGDGLVGRVKDVGPFSATVLLAADPTSRVGARLEGSRQVGFVQGDGLRSMPLTLLDPTQKVRAGDRLVTYGSAGSRPFVPGVPIGTVTRVVNTPGALTRSALVTPFVNFSGLDLVGVVVSPPRVDPRDSVLPPRPAAPPRPLPARPVRPAPIPSPTPGG